MTTTQPPTVIKIGGTTLEDPKTSPQLWDAIAALASTRPIIVVHGGGKAVDRLLDKLAFSVERKNGLRVTPPDQIGYITGVLAGTINKSIVATLSTRGLRPVGICLGDGGSVPIVRNSDVDLGLVGGMWIDPDRRHAHNALRHLVAGGFTPVLSSIGIGAEGELLNVNADDAATGAAYYSGASAVVLMTDVPGILDQDKELIQHIDFFGIRELVNQGVISGGMIPKAMAAGSAATLISAPVTIISGNDADSLARWAAGQPVGTTVSPIRLKKRDDGQFEWVPPPEQ